MKHLYKVEKKPEDLREIYLTKLKELSYITSFEERYFALLYLIRTGLNLLPADDASKNKNPEDDNAPKDNNNPKKKTIAEFKKGIRAKLKLEEDSGDKKSIYPSDRITKYSRKETDSAGDTKPIFIYEITSDESGDIEVETTDYKEGIKDCKEQQFSKLDDKLSDINDDVLDKLVETNVIPSMKPTIKDVVDKRIKKLYDKVGD